MRNGGWIMSSSKYQLVDTATGEVVRELAPRRTWSVKRRHKLQGEDVALALFVYSVAVTTWLITLLANM